MKQRVDDVYELRDVTGADGQQGFAGPMRGKYWVYNGGRGAGKALSRNVIQDEFSNRITARLRLVFSFVRCDGSKPAAEVLEEAKRREIKRGTLQHARETLGVKVEKQTGVKHGSWVWSLPAETQPKPTPSAESESNVVPFQNQSSSE